MAKRRILILFLIFTLVGLTALLAACGDDDKERNPRQRPPPSLPPSLPLNPPRPLA
ncbi:MAG: hypothetical protein M5U29_14510 [Anaerolineae bacterium]|nr:hypothetical protein [Anaerolineae bacterium]